MLQISSLLHCYTPARRLMQELQAGEISSAPSGLEVGSLNSAAQAGRPRLRPYQHTMQLDVGTWALARFVEGHVLPSTGNATLSLVAGGLCHIAAQQAKRSRPIVRRPGLGPSWVPTVCWAVQEWPALQHVLWVHTYVYEGCLCDYAQYTEPVRLNQTFFLSRSHHQEALET